MKKTLFILMMLCAGTGFSQKITNVRSGQDGNNINIFYDLNTSKADQVFRVSVFCSTDGGKTYGSSLKGVTGDVGNNVAPGKNKKIIWSIFQDVNELKGEVVFNVKAELISNNKDNSDNNDPYRKKILIASSNSNQAKGGFMAGRIGKKGFYVSLRHSINQDGFSTSSLECDTVSISNYDKTEEYYKFTGSVFRPRFSLCGGGTYQFSKYFHAYSGLGFGFSSLYWKIEEYKYLDGSLTGSRWVKNKDFSTAGLEWEGGLLLSYKWFVAHAGFTTLNFTRTNITVGLGIAF